MVITSIQLSNNWKTNTAQGKDYLIFEGGEEGALEDLEKRVSTLNRILYI